MTTLLGLAAVVALIAANGYFVAAEFGYVAADRNGLEAAAAAGDRRAGRAVRVLKRLSFMLSGAQFGITVTSLAVGFIAEPVFREVFEPLLDALGVPADRRAPIAIGAGFVIATLAQMLFGELAPKNLAIARPEPIARRLGASMLGFLRYAGPIVRLFDGASNRLLRRVGIEPVEELHGVVDLRELDVIVEESASEGSLDLAQAKLLERALVFPDLSASEVATPRRRVVTIPADASGTDLRDLIASAHSRFPVVDAEGDVVGVVHARSLLGIPRAAWATTSVSAMMEEPVFVPETLRLPRVLETLRDSGSELAVVLDEHGDFTGILTDEDLVEELVGDISDETDPSAPVLAMVGEGRWVVPGSWRPDEVARDLGVFLPEGEYETVAGLILDRLGRLAVVGDRVEVDGVTLIVTGLDGRAIAHVELVVAHDRSSGSDAEA